MGFEIIMPVVAQTFIMLMVGNILGFTLFYLTYQDSLLLAVILYQATAVITVYVTANENTRMLRRIKDD